MTKKRCNFFNRVVYVVFSCISAHSSLLSHSPCWQHYIRNELRPCFKKNRGTMISIEEGKYLSSSLARAIALEWSAHIF